MTNHLLLVDYETVPMVDMSVVDDSYRAMIFVGATRSPPREVENNDIAHRFRRATFHNVSGTNKAALDFHIAFYLGRAFETSPHTVCIVVSRDDGFDPLLRHLNSTGLRCRRVESFSELVTSH